MKNNHYTYRITNLITNEFYVGVRSCDCPIENDPYMGSSSIWTKDYIKQNKDHLKKEIVETFETRELANGGEIKLLKEFENNPLCVNQYFDYTPDISGIKQTPEWIAKRIHSGERAPFYGHHHSDEVKEKISKAMKERVFSDEHRRKIGDANRGKVHGEETRSKISKARQKIRHIEDIITGESWNISITEFIKMKPNEDLKPASMRKNARMGSIYKKRYKITECAASISNDSSKSGKNGEPPEVDNPVGSIESE